MERQRLDKWLWHARVVKARTSAAALVESGHVRVNGVREKAPGHAVNAGDVVTITIRYANTGVKAISDLVVSDSLSGRLEYIAGSAETDRPGNFTTAANEAGSVVVRWDLPGTLLPGQAGMVRFKAKVR